MKIYVDMDGVLCDWESEVLKLARRDLNFGGKYKELTQKVKMDLINRHYGDFYLNLPWMPLGKELWEILKPYNPEILSAMSQHYLKSLPEKYEWCKRELGLPKDKVHIVTRKSQKQKWALSRDGGLHILIDDKWETCEQWINNGGKAFHYEPTYDMIYRIEGYLKV